MRAFLKSSAAFVAFVLGVATLTASDHVIRFTSPATGLKPAWEINDFSATIENADPQWERRSLPIGNGSFGGNSFGGIATERFVLNEKSLWNGGPAADSTYRLMNRWVPDSLTAVVRNHLRHCRNATADSLVAEAFSGTKPYDRTSFGCYTVLGEALVDTHLPETGANNYRRGLDLTDAVSFVDFTVGDTRYSRRYFASYPDSLMVWRFTSSLKPQHLTFRFVTPQTVDSVIAAPGGLIISGHLAGNGMKWSVRVMARTREGSIKAHPAEASLSIEGSRDVEFLLAAATDYRINFNPDLSDPRAFSGGNPRAQVDSIISAAASLSHATLLARHKADYRHLYSRVKLDINPDEPSRDSIATPDRLEAYRAGASDSGLEELYFNFGRYLLIASSRKGSLPANLQGMWHNNIDGPWRIDYHNNINLQMNYWLATSTNLAECFIPFIDYVRTLTAAGAATATYYYRARGWTAAISGNPFGFTAPLRSPQMSWNYNPSAGPWLASQLYEYYDFTRDIQWLRDIGYPIIAASADFATDLLVDDGHGNLTCSPSYSPEHGTADLGATYANAVAREVLKSAIASALALNVDSTRTAGWRTAFDHILPYRTGRYGQLREWYNDIDEYGDQHRHTNHLFGLHPGTTINALTDSIIANACRETLRQRGDAATGWSMGWKLNHWARLLDGDRAYTLLRNLLSNGTADNLWDLHPPFQIDGNFGGTAGIAEMLLQSHNGAIHLLPALPSAWHSGSVSGLRARGNFEVDITWRDGRLTEATIHSLSSGAMKLLYTNAVYSATPAAGESVRVTFESDGFFLRR